MVEGDKTMIPNGWRKSCNINRRKLSKSLKELHKRHLPIFFKHKLESNFFIVLINTFLQDPSVFVVREIHHVRHVILRDLEENAHETEQMY